MAAHPARAPQAVDDLQVPPHATEAEQAVLGGLMLANESWDRVADRLVEDDFYRGDHRLIFRAITELAEKGQPFDVVTLREWLDSRGETDSAGGAGYLISLAKDTPSAANITAYADIVHEKAVLRQLIETGTEITAAAYRPNGNDARALLERAEKRVAQVAHQSSARIPQPQKLPEALPPVPTLDPLLLPDAMRPWIQDISDRIQCAPDYPAIGAMVALAAVVGRQIGIRPRQRDDWTVVPNLWGAIVGRPGLLKTPALAEVMRPLQRLEARGREEYEAAQREYEAERSLSRATAKETDKQIAKAIRSGDQDKARDLAMASAADDTEEPRRRRYLTSDTTVEALGTLLAANPRGLLVYRDELIGWLRSLDREGQEGSRAFWLEAWNGIGRYTYDRIGRGTIDIEAACVSVLGGIQPGPLGAYLRECLEGGAGDDGLLQRLQLVAWPDPPASWKDLDRFPDTEARRTAWEVFDRLDGLNPEALGAQRDGEDSIPYLRLDPAAAEIFRDWRGKLEHRLRTEEEHPSFEAALAKYRSLVPSLALLIHLADSPDGGAVSEAAMLSALAWAEYLEDHARRLYAPALDPALHAARELDRRIRSGDLEALTQDGDPPGTFRARAVYVRGWRGLDRRSTEEALEYLEDLGRVTRQEHRTGGRPTTLWRVHPALRQGGGA